MIARRAVHLRASLQIKVRQLMLSWLKQCMPLTRKMKAEAEALGKCKIQFVGRDVTVAYYPRSLSSKGYAVTFDYMSEEAERLHPSPYMYNVLETMGYDQIHVFHSWNHWYQTPEFQRLSEIVARAKGSATPDLVIGASMGGYGALKAGSLLKPRCTIAFSPQTFI